MARWNRRNFMKGSLAAAGSTPLLSASAGAAPQASASGAQRIVDTHVYLSRWPGRRMIGDEPNELVSRLRKWGVTQAWTGSFDALLHRDTGAVNERLAADCAQHGQNLLIPFGAVNPILPDWAEDLRRCHEQFRMPGIRVHPNYHAYTLEEPAFSRLLHMATERNLIVQIVAWMEDERIQIPALQAQPVDLLPLIPILEKLPKAHVTVLNGFVSLRSVQLPWDRLRRLDNVVFDISMLEQLMGVKVLVEAVGVERVVFGSYSPMFYFESSSLKLRESNLSEEQTAAILHSNAGRWLSIQRA
jgi:hypothetical protein